MEQNTDNQKVIWQIAELFDITATQDDDINNTTDESCLLVVLDLDATGDIKVLLANETAPRTIDARLAIVSNVMVQKVYLAGTDVNFDDLKLGR